MTRGPLRLRDDPSQPEELRELLSEAHPAPPRLDSATKAASIASVLAGAGAASASAVAASGVTATGVKLWLLLGGLCAGGVVAGVAWSPPADEPVTRTQPSAALAPPASAPAPAVDPEPETTAPPPSAAPVEAPPAPERARPRGELRPASVDSLRAEAALLENARAYLESDPGAALRATRRHAIAHPGGQLESERELIAIEALLGLGRTARADRRARAFLRARPTGIHADRVRRLLARVETARED